MDWSCSSHDQKMFTERLSEICWYAVRTGSGTVNVRPGAGMNCPGYEEIAVCCLDGRR